MKLKKISLNNIRSYENETVEFSEGSTLLSGDIGSGKTSILLAIEFALFGLQPGQRGLSLLRNQRENGGVIIEFEIDDKNIFIERTLKKGKTISKNYCAITINGEKEELSVTELKNKVLNLLNYPQEFAKKQNLLYKFTVYTPQEEMKQIILEDAETRINTLRHVFGIDKYKKIIENASIVASKLREEKRVKEGITMNLEQDKITLGIKEQELLEKKNKLLLINNELEEKQKIRKTLEIERDEIFKKIEEKRKLEQEVEKTKLIITNKKDTIFNNNKQIDELKKQIDELKKIFFDPFQIEEIEKELYNFNREKSKLNENILDINSKMNALNLRNNDSEKLQAKFSNLEICPTCLQNVDAIYRANILNQSHSEIAKNKRKIEDLNEEKKILVQKISKINLDIPLLEKKLQELNLLKIKLERIKEKEAQLNVLLNYNKPLENDIRLLEEHMFFIEKSFSDFKNFEIQYATKQKETEEASRKERLEEIKKAEIKREIHVFSIQIDELKDKLMKVEEIKKELDYIAELETWITKQFVPVVSHVERNVMIKLNLEFSKLFNKWFCMLVSDSFNVRLSNNFTPIIEQQDYEIDYAYLSGGERTAVALAYRLSLNQVINSLLSKIKTRDLVILDEPTDGFSDQQLNKIRDVLQELDVGQLIIVSHEQKIEGFVENIIKFKKENGISLKE